jgi:alpha-galactosidase
MPTINNDVASVYLGDDFNGDPEFSADPGALFALRLHSGNGHLLVRPPVFSLDGARVVARPEELVAARPPANVFGDVWEHWLSGRLPGDDATLEIVLRVSNASPVVRFRYGLRTDAPARLTRPDDGRDELVYLSASLTDFPDAAEVRFSEFSELFHSFVPSERPLAERHFQSGVNNVFGPLLVATDNNIGGPSVLLAYEHGSQVPDAFLAYDLSAPGRLVTLRAVKGNYCHGQIVGPDQPFETPWFQMALVDGDTDHLAREYRTFVLRHLSPNAESRKPYIFYNTWNYQERVHAWKQQPYLSEMNEARMLAEIEAAAKMGIDVFVIDTGWYEKTGDWQVSRERFPNGLAPLKAKLDEHNMKLGLWFNPTVAAVSSQMHARHRDCLMTRNGKPGDPHPVWETEPSQGLCLVSRYGDAFADELIRLHDEIGVTYFKWDAIGQYGCDAPGHGHGTEENTPEERRNAYAFQLGAAMTRVVDKLCAACPDAIVDFDITEGGRTVGLQFLSAGKYFLINNGPYSHNYNLPTPADGNVNLFFYAGPARAWICRAPLASTAGSRPSFPDPLPAR